MKDVEPALPICVCKPRNPGTEGQRVGVMIESLNARLSDAVFAMGTAAYTESREI